MKTLSLILFLTLLLIAAPRARAQGFSDTSGAGHVENTSSGESALISNTTGNYNAAFGNNALEKNTQGNHNTAAGFFALNSNTTGNDNAAFGYTALNFNTTGHDNAAAGCYALEGNTVGHSNTALGSYALTANTSGTENTASGVKALFTNKTGAQNTAAGFYALYSSTGSQNTAVGMRALNYLSTGEDNVALGYEAGYNVTTGGNNIEIGAQGDKDDSQTIRLGTQGTQKQAFIAGIFGATASGGVPVVVTPDGQLGTVTSSARFKRDIRDMGDVTATLMALRPVTFEYRADLDPAGTPQFGLIAEEVAQVAPNLVVRDAARRPYTVRYDAVNAMLLNEVQKEHKIIAEQQTALTTQQKLLDDLTARVAVLEKVQR
ncbi:MAG TPA: tail fiber domain-containing protein [Candidatus Methylacidiphilales bacterium]|nr:tail fiber domain-containing protein [Candidatus Methylacidiphilales bacterium]